MTGKVFIGTSGFSYRHWRGVFYPKNLAQKDWFVFYCQNFSTVEINSSFYHLPPKTTFEKWRNEADRSCLPAGSFVFSLKGSRFITHIKRLKNCQGEVERFFEVINTPAVKDVVLWQLPPGLKADTEKLEKFLKMLSGKWRSAFEFRDESWLNREVYDLLGKFNSAVVFQDYPGWPITEKITAGFVYLRLHGKTSLYSSCYTEKELNDWAKKIKKWLKDGLDVYAYFNNDAMGYAVKNAKKLTLNVKS